MEIEGEQTLSLGRDLVWAALNDAEILKASIPGCERVTTVSGNAWEITLGLTRGSVHTRFRGRLVTTDVNAPEGGTLVFDGDGGAAGALRGTARITLETVSSHSTRLLYVAELHLGGRLARANVGEVERIAAAMLQRFLEVLGATPPVLGSPALQQRKRGTSSAVLSRLRRWLKRPPKQAE